MPDPENDEGALALEDLLSAKGFPVGQLWQIPYFGPPLSGKSTLPLSAVAQALGGPGEVLGRTFALRYHPGTPKPEAVELDSEAVRDGRVFVMFRDRHTEEAALLFGVPYDEATAAQRAAAELKTLAGRYGADTYGLPGVPEQLSAELEALKLRLEEGMKLLKPPYAGPVKMSEKELARLAWNPAGPGKRGRRRRYGK